MMLLKSNTFDPEVIPFWPGLEQISYSLVSALEIMVSNPHNIEFNHLIYLEQNVTTCKQTVFS